MCVVTDKLVAGYRANYREHDWCTSTIQPAIGGSRCAQYVDDPRELGSGIWTWNGGESHAVCNDRVWRRASQDRPRGYLVMSVRLVVISV